MNRTHRQVWKLSACDLCEIARNSVVQSGFPAAAKAHWVGAHHPDYPPHPEADDIPSFHPNDLPKSNVPDLRIVFRRDTLLSELFFISSGAAVFAKRPKHRH